MYFSAWDSSRGNELWASDGTAVGTTIVRDLNEGSASGYGD
jgi:ELWxxDGT repeat protein